MKQFKFEYLGASKLKALSGNSRASKFHRSVHMHRFPNQKFQLKSETWTLDIKGGHQFSGYGKTQRRKLRKSKKKLKKTSRHSYTIWCQLCGSEKIVIGIKIPQKQKQINCDLVGRKENCSWRQTWFWRTR